VLAPLCGKPLLGHIVDRIKASTLIERVVLATTTESADDELATWGQNNGLLVFRGSSADVLARFYFAAEQYGIDTIARVTSDDPFKDPQVLDAVLSLHRELSLDFTCNNNPPTFPEGLDTEVFSFASLQRAQRESTDMFEREHVTQFFYRHPELFRQQNLSYKEDVSYLRWTIDTPSDFAMAERVYNELYGDKRIFLMEEILGLLKRKPDIAQMNASVARSAMYKH
jgi:spore coat polysaccharide biosynthesis protein SpsF